MRKTLLAAVLGLSLFGLTACAGEGEQAGQEATSTEQQTSGQGQAAEQPSVPEPDLEGIPEVVAEVDGHQIGRDEFVQAYEGQFQQMVMQAQMSGQEVDQDQLKQQTVDSMVGTQLLIQEADRRSFTASDEQVDATLEEIAKSNGLGSSDELVAALGEQGMSEEEVRTQAATQTKLDQLVADEAGDTTPTEEELRKLYDESVAQQPAAPEGEEQPTPPSFEEVRPQLEQQLRSQKEGEVVEALVTSLRESADVKINLE
jgi:SurA N-terminal domain